MGTKSVGTSIFGFWPSATMRNKFLGFWLVGWFGCFFVGGVGDGGGGSGGSGSGSDGGTGN